MSHDTSNAAPPGVTAEDVEPALDTPAEPVVIQNAPVNPQLLDLAYAAYPGGTSYVIAAESATHFVVEVDGVPRKLSKGV